MTSRADAHKDFVNGFGWSTGRQFLLCDMMTEHKEMLEDAAHQFAKYINKAGINFRIKGDSLMTNAKILALFAQEVAAEEEVFPLEFETPKLSAVQRLVAARVERLSGKVAGRRLP